MTDPVPPRRLVLALSLLAAVLGASPPPAAGDWPMQGRDIARSGVTRQRLDLPLVEVWSYAPVRPPAPSWPPPARQDFWHEIAELRPAVTHDRFFAPVVCGGLVYFASSGDDQVRALDLETGEARWTFFCEAPVRLAPSAAGGKLLFGSDDGWVYCVEGERGTLVWRFRPFEDDRRIAGNGRIISSRPVRTDVLVDAGVAYAAFGLFPNEGVALCAIDIETGSPVWCRRDLDISPQGYLLASPSHLCVPCGRAPPIIFDRSSGRRLGELKAPGGSFALVSGETILSGPGLKGGNDVGISDSATREAIFTFAGLRAVVTGNMAYVQSADDLSALEYPQLIALARERRPFLEEREQVDSQREKALAASRREEAEALQTALEALDERIAALDERIAGCTRWRKPWPLTDALVLAGEHLITGGAGEVAALRAAGGEVVWRAAVPGRAGSLCVS
ncbi:MAG: PQQ-binding-like beta-propeller repeat protein, partial [Planctomycetes bacterium]|nr:PQQ-binding-like beta-propeller repeat protein [Planctomycetota bacterium]